MVKAVNDLNDSTNNSTDEVWDEAGSICMDYDFSMDNVTNVRCRTHTLLLCVNDAMKSTDIKEKLDIIRSIVKKLRTQTYLNLLKTGDCKMPVLDNVTRWNSTYLMVERFVVLREFIEALKHDNSFFDVSEEIWNFSAEFIKLLKIVYIA